MVVGKPFMNIESQFCKISDNRWVFGDLSTLDDSS